MQFDSSEYDFLPVSFKVLTLCGTWYPENWSTKKRRIYKIYTTTIVLLATVLLIEIVINIYLTKGTEEFNLENLFALNVFCVGLWKKTLVICDRKKILKLIRYCAHKDEWHQPETSVENTVKQNIQDETKKLSVLYAILIMIALILRAVQPVIDAKTLIVLPLDAWYPYSVDNFFVFTLTFFHQFICGVVLTCMHLTSDTLFVGFMIQVNYQLKILALRLKKIGYTDKSEISKVSKTNNCADLKYTVVRNIDAHIRIHRFGNDLQRIFKKMSMGQMVVLIPNLILNVYFLSIYTDRFDLKYLMTFVFFVVPLMQIYMFCWYGNEIILACSDINDALYKSDWIQLSQSTKKLLLPIFMRSTQPIVISAMAVIPYNVDSFIKIMKTSYSAFNLLQQTAGK